MLIFVSAIACITNCRGRRRRKAFKIKIAMWAVTSTFSIASKLNFSTTFSAARYRTERPLRGTSREENSHLRGLPVLSFAHEEFLDNAPAPLLCIGTA